MAIARFMEMPDRLRRVPIGRILSGGTLVGKPPVPPAAADGLERPSQEGEQPGRGFRRSWGLQYMSPRSPVSFDTDSRPPGW